MMPVTIKLTYFTQGGAECGTGSCIIAIPNTWSPLSQICAEEVARMRAKGTLPSRPSASPQDACDLDILIETPDVLRLLRAEPQTKTAENKFYDTVDAWLMREIPRLRDHEIESAALTLSIGNPGAREVILRASSQSVEIPRVGEQRRTTAEERDAVGDVGDARELGAAPPVPTPSPARHARPATRHLLRSALAIARDALVSSSENFRGEVGDVLVDLLGESAAVDGDDVDGAPAIARLGELRRAVVGLASPDLRRCALCDEVLSPAEGKTFDVDDGRDLRQVTLHDDLPHCALLALSRTLRAWVAERQFDDDQDPALDTIDQRLVRAYSRLAALVGDSDDAHAAMVSCDVCDAFGYGSATCWSCAAHWRWATPGLRREMVARLIDCTPGRPCGPEEVQAFVDRLAATTQDASPVTHQAHLELRSRDGSREIPWPNTGRDLDLRRAVGSCLLALRSGHPPPDEDIAKLRGRGDRLVQFAEIEGAVAALLRTIDDEAEDAQRAERGDR